MDTVTWTTMQENLYRTVLTLIEYLTLAVGLLVTLFIIACIACAVCDHPAETTRPARRCMSLCHKATEAQRNTKKIVILSAFAPLWQFL